MGINEFTFSQNPKYMLETSFDTYYKYHDDNGDIMDYNTFTFTTGQQYSIH